MDKTDEIRIKGQNGNAIRMEYHTEQASISITVQSEVENLKEVDEILWSYIMGIKELNTPTKEYDNISYG